MDVRICGPNLNDQSKGTFHVHANGCGDLKHYGPGRKFGGDCPGESEMLLTNTSVRQVVYETYIDQIEERDAEQSRDEAVDDLVNDFWFAPCCKDLPYSLDTSH